MVDDSQRDTLQRFLFEHAAIRGEVVRLDMAWRMVLERHDYPLVVRDLLGEMMAAAALLSSMLKFDGSLIMQILGDGPIPLMVMEASSDRTLRGMAQWKKDIQPAPLSELLGKGTLSMTIDLNNSKERYQGIVAIEGDSLAQVLENYLLTSDQLETRLWLAADDQQTAGLLLQRMPDDRQQDDDENWNRLTHLAGTIKRDELLQLPTKEIVHRLFYEEDVRLFDGEHVAFQCSCSRERVSNMLRGFGYDEVMAILDEEGAVKVNCEYCNQHYEFDAIDAEQIFAASDSPVIPPTKH